MAVIYTATVEVTGEGRDGGTARSVDGLLVVRTIAGSVPDRTDGSSSKFVVCRATGSVGGGVGQLRVRVRLAAAAMAIPSVQPSTVSAAVTTAGVPWYCHTSVCPNRITGIRWSAA